MRFIKRCVKGFYMSLGMFCAIPLPFHIWDDACMNLMLPSFPIIGIIIGAIWWGAAGLLALSGVHAVLAAAILAAAPFLLTGFLHLDGFMDTSDAVLSRRPLEDKLRIIKDPHRGAFSVIMLAVLFMLMFAALYAGLDHGANFVALIPVCVVSRCCASISLLSLDVMPQSGYAKMFRQNARLPHKVFIILAAVAATAASYMLAGLTGLICVIATIIGFICAMAYAYKDFKGVSGDLAGFSLVIGELCGLIALSVIT